MCAGDISEEGEEAVGRDPGHFGPADDEDGHGKETAGDEAASLISDHHVVHAGRDTVPHLRQDA